jgi:Mrp family chromosome partitioning ATPase
MSLPFEMNDKKFLLHMKSMHQQMLVGNNGGPVKNVLITSVARGHGVSTVSANLAYTLSKKSESKVLLVDGNGAGLTSVETLEDALKKPLTENLFVIKATWCEAGEGGICFRDRFEKIREEFSYIIIDSPPVTKVPEVLGVVPMVDLVLILLKANTTKWQVLSKLQETIEEAKPKSLKVVLNKKIHYIPKKLYRWM